MSRSQPASASTPPPCNSFSGIPTFKASVTASQPDNPSASQPRASKGPTRSPHHRSEPGLTLRISSVVVLEAESLLAQPTPISPTLHRPLDQSRQGSLRTAMLGRWLIWELGVSTSRRRIVLIRRSCGRGMGCWGRMGRVVRIRFGRRSIIV